MSHSILYYTKRVLSKPAIIIPIAVVVALIIGVASYRTLNTSEKYPTTAVELGTVSTSLTTTGTVKAATQTSLAFPEGGRVASVSATVGEHVSKGQVLASLDSTTAEGAVSTAEGAYQAAQAAYAKLVNGASTSDIAIAKLNYQTTVSEETIAVQTADQTLLSSDLVAVPVNTTSTVTPPVISGTYNGTTQGVITIQVNPVGNSGFFNATGLITATGDFNTQTPQEIGTSGLYIVFSGGDAQDYSTTNWTISIPNTEGPEYTADSTAYTAALQEQTDKVAEAQAALDQVEAAPRSEDTAAAQAQIASAEGALQSAQGALADDFITAPMDGIITSVNDVTPGSIVSANTPVIDIISQGAFQIESYVSEKDLGIAVVDTPVSIVTDAYGPSVVFKGTIVEVDPAATTQADGSLGYKVTYQFAKTDPRIKPGMTATVTIQGQEKDNVLELPSTAIFLQNGASFVLVQEGKNNVVTPVTTGLVGDGNTEIVSGLTQGEQVVTLGNN